MAPTLHDCVQGSDEWLEFRRGIPTASNFGRIFTPKKGELSTSAVKYCCELIAEERYLGPMDDLGGVATAAMRNGIILEPKARRCYEFQTGSTVDQAGFFTNGGFGCSPDGLVGADGLLEAKCPEGKRHVEYLLAGVLPDAYKPQVHGQLIVTERAWCDFLSYCEGLPPLIVRVEPNSYTDKIRRCMAEFLKLFDEVRAHLDLPAPARDPIPESEIPF